MPIGSEWKDQVDSLRAVRIADFRVERDETAADLTGEQPKRKATTLRCQPSAFERPAEMKCTRRPVSGPSRRYE